MVRRLVVALVVAAIMVAAMAGGAPCRPRPRPPADGFLRALAKGVVRVPVGVVVLVVVEVVLQPLDPGSLVRGLGRLGVGALCRLRI